MVMFSYASAVPLREGFVSSYVSLGVTLILIDKCRLGQNKGARARSLGREV